MTRRKIGLGSTLKSSTDPDAIEELVNKIHAPQKKDSASEQAAESRGEVVKKSNPVPKDDIVTTSFKLPKSLLKEIKRKAIDEETSVGNYLVSLIYQDLSK